MWAIAGRCCRSPCVNCAASRQQSCLQRKGPASRDAGPLSLASNPIEQVIVRPTLPRMHSLIRAANPAGPVLHSQMSAFDPKRTFDSSALPSSQPTIRRHIRRARTVDRNNPSAPSRIRQGEHIDHVRTVGLVDLRVEPRGVAPAEASARRHGDILLAILAERYRGSAHM